MTDAPAFTTSTITTGGGCTCTVRRAGHGVTVVWLGDATATGTAAAADEIVPHALAAQFAVVALSIDGAAGGAGGPDGDPRDLAMAHEDVLAALGLTNVPVVGWGRGAVAAAELAAHAPARVAKLVLVEPTEPGPLLRRTYRIAAPTRVVLGVGSAAAANGAALATAIASCDLTGVDTSDPAAVVGSIDAHLRGKAPGANDGLLIRHIDDLEWHEVRVMLVDGRRSVVKNRFVDFGTHRTICHTWYDPGIALARHSHFTEELIYVLEGGFWIDDVWCPQGTVIVLSPGTYFGPLIAGPEGAYLLEAFPGIGVRAGQDRAGWEARAAALKVEPLPDPPFNPPSAARPGS